MTLAKALEIGRNHETSVSDLKTITEEDATVKFVGHGRGRSKGKGQDRNPKFSQDHNPKFSQDRNPKFSNRKKNKSSGDQAAQKCTRCGYDAHPKSKCPDLNEKCSKCRKRGHFAQMCRRTETHNMEEADDSDDSDSDLYLHRTHLVHTVKTTAQTGDWWETIQINQCNVKVQINTGSSQSLMSYSLYKN